MPTASVVVPTRDRAAYLEVALASVAPQARALGAELLVVDDGSADAAATAVVAERHGARLEAHDVPRGLNAARNTGLARTTGDLVVFVDDDVEAPDGWLRALLDAAEADPEAEVLGGPIRARLEGCRVPMCGREDPPITALDHGPADRDVERIWGANLAVRRAAVERVGPFDAGLGLYGDEEEWQERVRSTGGRVRYVAAAGLDHRRARADTTLAALARAARARGRSSRRYDARLGDPPPVTRELRVLAGTLWHTVRRRCGNGIVMAAHTYGRLEEALKPAAGEADPGVLSGHGEMGAAGDPDFLSGRSGTVGGRRAVLLDAQDALLDLAETVSGRRARLARAARSAPPRRRVLVAGVDRPERNGLMGAARAELGRTRHDVEFAIASGTGDRGKFENLNSLLSAHPPGRHDWLLVVDDDVVLPPGFLDTFLFCAERFDLELAQPAHRRRSHAAWDVTRRRPGSVVRETAFVEIGPVTAFHAGAIAELLPFPDLRMGWGLDVHWAAMARERGWRIGVVDATPIAHAQAPAATAYDREQAVAEAAEFLRERPYLPRAQANRTLAAHRTW
jgi:GT2 family glycosyltransferase